jgi:Flp pilus assembly protein CpaB
LKRSSRLIILVGIVLAVAAFGGVVLLSSNTSQPTQTPPPATAKVVVANADIALGSAVTVEQLATKDVPVTAAPVNGFSDPGQLVGRVVRRDVRKGEVLTSPDFSSGLASQGDEVVRALKPGYRAMSIIVDRISGVGTLIQPGDRVDVVIGLKVQQYAPGADPGAVPIKFPDDPQLTVKNLLQNVEVLGTMVIVNSDAAAQAAAQANTGQAPAGASAAPGGTTTRSLPVVDTQRQIVILAVTAQQAEVLKYGQIMGVPSSPEMPVVTMNLILRAPADRDAPPDKTTGITLQKLVEEYGVLPPQVQRP